VDDVSGGPRPFLSGVLTNTRLRRDIVVAALALVGTALLASGCGLLGQAAEEAGPALGHAAEEAGAAAARGAEAGRAAEEAGAAAGRAALEAGRAAPGAGRAAEAAGAAAAAATREAEALADSSAAAIAQHAQGAASDIVLTVPHAQDPKAEFVDDVMDATAEAIKEIVCDLAAGPLLPAERSTARDGDDGNLPSIDELVDRILTRLSVRWSNLERAFDWVRWATSVQEVGGKIAAGIATGTVQEPNGPTSRSFLVYARACLAPPG
jgi:hypothetical protein